MARKIVPNRIGNSVTVVLRMLRTAGNYLINRLTRVTIRMRPATKAGLRSFSQSLIGMMRLLLVPLKGVQ